MNNFQNYNCRYHKAHLTRRLILDSSADSEKEEDMVDWLREIGMPAGMLLRSNYEKVSPIFTFKFQFQT